MRRSEGAEAPWRRRFRAARLSLPSWARDEPERLLYSSNAGGKWELTAESLTMLRELGAKARICECVEGLASMACAQGQPERGARLFGAAQALREAIGAPMPRSDHVAFDPQVDTLRATLGDAAFVTAWAQGRAMTLEQAVECALAGRAQPGLELEIHSLSSGDQLKGMGR